LDYNFCSCWSIGKLREKNDSNEPPLSPSKRISSISPNTDPTYYLEYNDDGKLAKFIVAGRGYHAYAYSGNIIINLNYFDGESTYDSLFLNSKGYVYKEKESSGREIIYEYDNSGYCIKETHNYSGIYEPTIFEYTWVNGNVSTETGSGNNFDYSYEYYLDKSNTIGNEYRGIFFYGKSNKNLEKKRVDNGYGVTAWTYEFDQDNYVTKSTYHQEWSGHEETRWETYTYE